MQSGHSEFTPVTVPKTTPIASRMFAVWKDDAVHMIVRDHHTAEDILSTMIYQDERQEHTWSICPVAVIATVTK